MLHRYSFNNGTASDSVGGSAYAGSLIAGAKVTNNQANFTKSGAYVNLPSGLFGNYTAVSAEAWVTTGVNTGYARIFHFGASGNSDANSLTVCRNNTPGSSAYYFSLMWVDASNGFHTLLTGVSFDFKKNVHVVMTVSGGSYARLYINGVLQGSSPVVVSPLPPATVFHIGSGLPYNSLVGSVNEFRIWAGVLSAPDIAARYSQGPGNDSSSY